MIQKIEQNLKCLYDTVSLRHIFYRVAQINGVSIWHSNVSIWHNRENKSQSIYMTQNLAHLLWFRTLECQYDTVSIWHKSVPSLYNTTKKTNLGMSIWHKKVLAFLKTTLECLYDTVSIWHKSRAYLNDTVYI